jgi:hypothetical protein
MTIGGVIECVFAAIGAGTVTLAGLVVVAFKVSRYPHVVNWLLPYEKTTPKVCTYPMCRCQTNCNRPRPSRTVS